MQAMIVSRLMVAVLNLGGGEIILIIALTLILFGAKKLPELARGLGQGLTAFRDATKDVIQTVDDESSEAGRSVGGIYGKPAAEALTPDNQVAELYNPAALTGEQKPRRTRPTLGRLLKTFWHRLLSFIGHGTNQTGTPEK